jgi:hypothetical protein
MTIEQFFRSQPAANAIVVCARDGAPRIFAHGEIFRGFDAARSKAPGARKPLLPGLVAFRREGKKK